MILGVCESCLQHGELQGHHDNYNHPDAIRYLCVPCHQRWHGKHKAKPASNGLGSRLLKWRAALKLSRVEASRIIICDPSAIMRWENTGLQPKGLYLKKIERLLRKYEREQKGA